MSNNDHYYSHGPHDIKSKNTRILIDTFHPSSFDDSSNLSPSVLLSNENKIQMNVKDFFVRCPLSFNVFMLFFFKVNDRSEFG